MAEQQRDVIEVLEHDHREVEEMFAELESLRGAASDEAKERRKDLADQVTIELVRHSVAEEVSSTRRWRSRSAPRRPSARARSTRRPRRRCTAWRSWTPTTPLSTTSSPR